MKVKSVPIFCLLLMLPLSVMAQVDNYALSFAGDGTVSCGQLVQMEGQTSYTIQFWMCPSKWVKGATIFRNGSEFSAALGAQGSVVFRVGDANLSVTSTEDLTVDTWAQVTLVCDEGLAKIYLNTKTAASATGQLPAIPATASPLIIGNNYVGRLDEMRFWKTALSAEFDYFRHTTLNQFNYEWDNLVAYYKMDQELCDNLVDYRGVFVPNASYNYHGILMGDAKKVKVTDNKNLPYLMNGAYTSNDRFFDRIHPRGQYLLSNDLIILGAYCSSDGHVHCNTPCNHGTLVNCQRLDAFQGRSGVLSLGGDGKMSVGKEALYLKEDENGKATGHYAFLCWLYLDQWTEGAYLFRKENEAGTQGFSIRLGAENTRQVIVRVDGRDYGSSGHLQVGQWTHLGILSRSSSTPSQMFRFVYNGNKYYGQDNLCDAVADNMPTNLSQYDAYIGEGLQGKLDDIMLYNNGYYDSSMLAGNMNGDFMMPGVSKSTSEAFLNYVNSLWRFDKADNPGYDSYSQDQWLAIMKANYDGYRGYRVRLTVGARSGWLETFSDSDKRKIFAADVAELSKPYDGVDMDVEWPYTTDEWKPLGLLAVEVRAALPAEKMFMMSAHGFTYFFPKDKIGKIDGLTVQQYGSQSEWSTYTKFVSALQNMLVYGLSRSKIYASYSTTTSNPYYGGTMQSGDIRGVADKMDGDYVPQEEVDIWTAPNGQTFYFSGPLQTYNRAKYIQDMRFKGIFYWDLANDAPVEHKYNLAKWCSYALNANVDTLITHVDVKPYDATEIRDVRYDADDDTLQGPVTIYGISGSKMNVAATKQEAMTSLPCGIYMITGRNRSGQIISEKVYK